MVRGGSKRGYCRGGGGGRVSKKTVKEIGGEEAGGEG